MPCAPFPCFVYPTQHATQLCSSAADKPQTAGYKNPSEQKPPEISRKHKRKNNAYAEYDRCGSKRTFSVSTHKNAPSHTEMDSVYAREHVQYDSDLLYFPGIEP
jgi:5-methylcytosine-specific restriction endonuclease McrA